LSFLFFFCWKDLQCWEHAIIIVLDELSYAIAEGYEIKENMQEGDVSDNAGRVVTGPIDSELTVSSPRFRERCRGWSWRWLRDGNADEGGNVEGRRKAGDFGR
jgi:hypothetical protein